MKINYLLLFLLLFIPLFSPAQCLLDIGPSKLICGANTLPQLLLVTYTINLQVATPPFTYVWSAEYDAGAAGIYTASDMLDDTTLEKPAIINYLWDPVDTLNVYGQKFHLKVTDALGETCEDSFFISYIEWQLNLDDCTYQVPRGAPVGLRHNIGGGVPPYQYAWSPNYAINDTTRGFPLATPDTSTVYTVTVTDQLGCVAESYCTVYITGSSIDPNQQKAVFSITANPLRTTTELILDHQSFRGLKTRILDLQGKVVFEKPFTSSHMDLKASEFQDGLYLCKIIDQDNQVLAVKKLMVLN